jgi:hypothetical protein
MDRELWSVYDEMASSHVAPHPYNADYDRPTVLAGSATPRGGLLAARLGWPPIAPGSAAPIVNSVSSGSAETPSTRIERNRVAPLPGGPTGMVHALGQHGGGRGEVR